MAFVVVAAVVADVVDVEAVAVGVAHSDTVAVVVAAAVDTGSVAVVLVVVDDGTAVAEEEHAAKKGNSLIMYLENCNLT